MAGSRSGFLGNLPNTDSLLTEPGWPGFFIPIGSWLGPLSCGTLGHSWKVKLNWIWRGTQWTFEWWTLTTTMDAQRKALAASCTSTRQRFSLVPPFFSFFFFLNLNFSNDLVVHCFKLVVYRSKAWGLLCSLTCHKQKTSAYMDEEKTSAFGSPNLTSVGANGGCGGHVGVGTKTNCQAIDLGVWKW